MSIPHVTDGVTELDSLLFNPIIDAANNATSAVANMRSGIFYALDYDGVDPTGATDSTAGIQAAIAAAKVYSLATGIKPTVVLPSGRFKLSLQSVYWSANRRYRLMVDFDGLTLLGAGNKQTVFFSTDTEANGHVTIAVCGQAKSSPDFTASSMYKYDLNFNSEDYFTYYPFQTAPVAGEYSVELDVLADAANFAVGDIVYLRAGQTIPIAGEGQPDAEYNRVTGISGAVLSLERPLLKNYEQEYFADADKDTATTTSSTAYPAVWGIANATDSTIDGFACIGIHFESVADDIGIDISTQQVIDATIRCTSNGTNMGFQGDGPWRNLLIEDADVIMNLTDNEGGWVSADRGCGDMTVSGRFLNRGTRLGIIHMNEGAANIRFKNADFINPELAIETAIFGQAGRGYRYSLNNVKVQGGGIDAMVKFIDVDGVIIDGCDLSRVEGKNSISLGTSTQSCANVQLGTNDYGRAAVAIHHNSDTLPAPKVQPVTLMGWVDYTNSTVVIGWLPLYAQVLRRSIKRTTNFNGGNPGISLGKAGNTSVLLGYTAVISADYESVAGLYIDNGYEILAEMTPDGASQGRALVMVEYINGLVPS